jgi:methionyl-tRNA formyltransferase
VKLFRPSLSQARTSDAPGAPGQGNGGPPISSGATAPEGLVLHADEVHGLVIGTGDGSLLVDEVQPPGRRRMPARDWIHGRGVRVGQRFE